MPTNSARRCAALLLTLILVVAACGDSDGVDTAETPDPAETTEAPETTEPDEPADAPDEPAAEPADSGSTGKPEVQIPEGDPPTELGIDDLIEGEGDGAQPGDLLVMHYVGVLHENGEQFDASWDRGQTFDFVLGQGRVIQGWDEGIVGMKVGGRRLLNIPPEQAYGSGGQGGIPPNSALVFVVDLVDIVRTPTVENAPEPVTELEVTVLEDGDGTEIATGSTVTMHYQILLQTTGEVIDSSYSRGQPLTFAVGTDPTIPAWDEALVGRRGGDVVRMVIPPGLGIDDPSGTIPADATIVTQVEILRVGG